MIIVTLLYTFENEHLNYNRGIHTEMQPPTEFGTATATAESCDPLRETETVAASSTTPQRTAERVIAVPTKLATTDQARVIVMTVQITGSGGFR